MLNLEILPRVIPDSYVDTVREALEEVAQREARVGDSINRIVKSPYGGFRIFTVSRSFAIEFFADRVEDGTLHLVPMPTSSRGTMS